MCEIVIQMYYNFNAKAINFIFENLSFFFPICLSTSKLGLFIIVYYNFLKMMNYNNLCYLDLNTNIKSNRVARDSMVKSWEELR